MGTFTRAEKLKSPAEFKFQIQIKSLPICQRTPMTETKIALSAIVDPSVVTWFPAEVTAERIKLIISVLQRVAFRTASWNFKIQKFKNLKKYIGSTIPTAQKWKKIAVCRCHPRINNLFFRHL